MALVRAWIEGRLGYNSQNDRYGLLVTDLWEHTGFHCGETLQVWMDDKWIDTRMEMAWENGHGTWYLVGTPYRGDDLEYVRARIVKTVESSHWNNLEIVND